MKKKAKLWKKLLAFVIAIVFVMTCYFGYVSVMKTLYPVKYDEFVEMYTSEYNLEKSFVFAVIKCESSFDKDAVSKVNAKGLMQIMPDTFTWLKTKTKETLDEDMLFDPETSVKYGCLLYRMLIDQFGNEETAVAAYHAGLGNVSKWLKNSEYSDDGVHLKKIPFPSTEKYVEKVIQAKSVYKKLYKM
ncbi:MAG: lytic transglycosylase domain-containing protein [Faecalibacterium sp.]|nr:lytic transglycosylase domain-containing protein [Ruminococcus sp.]MCM1391207.1 lytic transglycosylase domain-containing protein [Ruminococcus sp.]MCM1485665.1 lytic transglycosylase domain-containing protein [Faecalibacterium sp.]